MVTPQIRTAKLCRELCAQLSAFQGLLSPLCRTSTSNAAKAELLKSSKTQIPPVTIFYCTAIWQALQEHDGKNWETEEELIPSGHQAPKLKLSPITFTWLNLRNCETFTILHHPYCCYVYIPGTTCLHILLEHPCLYYHVLSPLYTVLHILF